VAAGPGASATSCGHSPLRETLTVVVEWPSQKIELTRGELDADPLLAAAAQSERLWPGDEPAAGGGFVSSQIVG